MIIYWILSILTAFLLGVNNWLIWPMLVVFWAASKKENAAKVYCLALAAGILTDILVGRTLGISAIFFLIGSGLIYWYRSRAQVPIILSMVYFVVLSLIFNFIWG